MRITQTLHLFMPLRENLRAKSPGHRGELLDTVARATPCGKVPSGPVTQRHLWLSLTDKRTTVCYCASLLRTRFMSNSTATVTALISLPR